MKMWFSFSTAPSQTRHQIAVAIWRLFRAALTQVKSRNQSGGNMESMFAEAKELYAVKDKKSQPFKLEHAWKILKFHVKWVDPSQASHSSSPLETNTPLSQDSDHISSPDRPTGMRQTKAKRKISKEKDPMWDEMMKNTTRSNELMEKQHKEWKKIEKAKLVLKNKKLQLEKQKQEMEIMNIDLTNLSPFSKTFWGCKKQALRDQESMPRSARTLDFNAGGSGVSNEDVYVPESPNSEHLYDGLDGVNFVPPGTKFPDLNYANRDFI